MANNDEFQTYLQHPIPVLSNRLILDFMKNEKIKIGNYNPKMLGPTSYKICAAKIRFHQEDEDKITLADGTSDLEKSGPRTIHPGEYVVVSPRESILLAPGLVADFYPSSYCIEKNLTITAGRLDANYHQSLVFGLYNGGATDFSITSVTQILRVTFGWLGNYNIPDYSDDVPGAYIPRLEQLRESEKRMAEIEADLKAQRELIADQISAIKIGK